MADVFISYARSTAGQARAVAAALRAVGYSVWLDDDLPTHRAYADVIQEELEGALAVVVIWSAEAGKSQWVRSEADRARNAGKLVQLSVDGAPLPMPFDQIQCVDLSGALGAVSAHPGWSRVEASLSALSARAPRPPAPTMPPGHASPHEPLLAVLPFDNLSTDQEMQFFSDGVSEDIIQRLSRGASLKVIGRTSSFQFRGLEKARAAEALGCSHLLDGSIRRAGARVRVTAHLTDARSKTTLWTDRYDRDLEDIFAVQDEISEEIAKALNTAFTPVRGKTADLGAYELFLRAATKSDEPEEIMRAIPLLELAVERDPNFADAWAMLAEAGAHHLFVEPYADRPTKAKVVRARAEQTLSLDPGNPIAFRALLLLAAPFGDFLEFERLARRSELVTESPRWTFGETGTPMVEFLHVVGRNQEALKVSARTLRLDPLNPGFLNQRAISLSWSGHFPEAAQVFDELIERYDISTLAWNTLMAKAFHHDWEAVDRIISPEGQARRPLRHTTGIIPALRLWRDPSEANRAHFMQRLSARAVAAGSIEVGSLVIASYAGLAREVHDLAETMALGPQGRSEDRLGRNAYRTHLVFMAPFADFRADPRFPKLCARLGLVEYWQASGHWPDCADEVPYDFQAACAEAAAAVPKEPFWPPR